MTKSYIQHEYTYQYSNNGETKVVATFEEALASTDVVTYPADIAVTKIDKPFVEINGVKAPVQHELTYQYSNNGETKIVATFEEALASTDVVTYPADIAVTKIDKPFVEINGVKAPVQHELTYQYSNNGETKIVATFEEALASTDVVTYPADIAVRKIDKPFVEIDDSTLVSNISSHADL